MTIFNTYIYLSFFKMRPLNEDGHLVFFWRNLKTDKGWYFLIGKREGTFYSMRNGLRGKWYFNDRLFVERLAQSN